MSQLTGFYTPDINIVSLDTASGTGNPTVVIRTPFGVGGQNGPVCVIVADASTTSGPGTLKIESGTWDGSVFTPDATNSEICFIAVSTTYPTEEEFVFKVTNGRTSEKDPIKGAIRITAAGAATKAHVRIQGQTISVP